MFALNSDRSEDLLLNAITVVPLGILSGILLYADFAPPYTLFIVWIYLVLLPLAIGKRNSGHSFLLPFLYGLIFFILNISGPTCPFRTSLGVAGSLSVSGSTRNPDYFFDWYLWHQLSDRDSQFSLYCNSFASDMRSKEDQSNPLSCSFETGKKCST